jgi:hypothetical protein
MLRTVARGGQLGSVPIRIAAHLLTFLRLVQFVAVGDPTARRITHHMRA